MTQPPKVEEVLVAIFEQKGKPDWMPADPLAAARWWMKIQKPPDEWADKPKQISVHGKDGMRWITPYADRLKHNLELFLKLPPTDQQYIVGAADDGVLWNGDEMPFFYAVYEETMKMKDLGSDKYRRRSAQQARALLKGMK